jgi:rhodanese-related sulfurtransferase
MSGLRPIIDEVAPAEAYDILRTDGSAVLIDVRSKAEWAFVGLPDLSAIDTGPVLVEWVVYPTMVKNPDFIPEVMTQLSGGAPGRLLFICRSGTRSMAAARAMAAALAERGLPTHCTNVAQGFEGDLDAAGHRGTTNGWKAGGLPWRQN